MKSNFLGLSAKLALAVLAVGSMFTSCYEEKGIDVTPVDPLPAAEYSIVGSIYSATTNEAISVASSEITATSGTIAQPTPSSFKITGLTADAVVTITVNKAGFFTATRTVSVAKVADGTTCVVNANVALTGVNDVAVVPPTEGEGSEGSPVAGDETLNNKVKDQLAGFGLPLDSRMPAPTFDKDGNAIAYALEDQTLDADPVAKYVDVTYNRVVDSFVIQDVTVGAVTRAISDVDATTLAYLARCVSAQTKLPYAGSKFKTEKTTVKLWKKANLAVKALSIKTILNLKSLTFIFDGKTYVVNFMTAKQSSIGFVYDNHDSHDYHDIHGESSNAGGGIGGSDI